MRLAFGTSLPAGVSAGATAATTVSITDDDDPQVTVSFGADTYTADEGGTATVTVTRSAAPERTVTLPITKTEQGGATSADYSGVPSSVTFNSGDMSKTIMFTAMADTEDDDGESVKLAFGKLPSGVSMGSPRETTVTIRQVSTEFILRCSLAVWCADMRFSDGTAVDWGWSRLRYEKDWDPPATVSDDTFTFRGVEYTLRRVDVHPGTYPIMPNAWSRTKQGYSYISLRITRGDYWDPPPREHYRDWVLHLDGLELPFKDAFRAGDEFQWIGVAFQELFNDWTSSTVTKIGIEEVAATAQEPTPAVPYTPIHVEAWASGRDGLYVRWDPPWWRVGVPDATGYIVQWKEAADSWSDSAAVSQREVRGGWQGLQQLDGLTEGALYSVRVFATNAAGDGPPSEDTLGRPQPLNPRLDSMSVNGRTLTMRYDQRLDGNSVPAATAFVVLAKRRAAHGRHGGRPGDGGCAHPGRGGVGRQLRHRALRAAHRSRGGLPARHRGQPCIHVQEGLAEGGRERNAPVVAAAAHRLVQQCAELPRRQWQLHLQHRVQRAGLDRHGVPQSPPARGDRGNGHQRPLA